MPSSTRTATPGPSITSTTSKRPISDSELAPKESKRPRRDASTDPNTKRDSKRRRRRKRKAPIVGPGVTQNEATPSRSGERSRAPLSARNEIIRFSSAAPEPDPSASASQSAHTSTQGVSYKPPSVDGETSSQTLDDTTQDQLPTESMPPAPKEKKRAIPADKPASEPSDSSLEEKVAQLTAELKSKNDLIASHQALVNQVQQAATCQICLDIMYKPYALAPCGHLACHDCLVQWFTAPPPDNREVPPPMMRRKTCPHCRAVIRERPVEVWGVKGIAQALGKSGLASIQTPAPVDAPENSNANTDPWKDIFPKAGRGSHHGFPWFLPGDDIDDDEDDIHLADVAPRGEDVGMLDMEDGGIYRCLDCMHEIWDGVCTSCGRVYPGHRQEGDEDDDEGEGHAFGFLDDQMGAEEVDIADDPGWMGLEDGEADDDGDGDGDDWHFDPWRHQFHMFRGPFGFLGAIHLEDEDDDDDEYDDDDDEYDDDDGHVHFLEEEDEGRHIHFLEEEADESDDDGYESSFIDDEDGPTGVELPRIYEIVDEGEEEEYLGDPRHHIVDLTSYDHDNDEVDEDECDHEGDGGPRLRAGRGFARIVVSSDEDDGEDVDGSDGALRRSGDWSRRRGGGAVESDFSDACFSDD